MLPKREINALVPVLEDITNADKSTEDLAEELITVLDAVRARHNRLAVVARYTLDGESWHMAALGPLSTRAVGAARELADGFMVPKHPGQGFITLVPIYATARDAWAAITPTQEERRVLAALARARRESGWNPWAPHGPVCRCGVARAGRRDTGLCPVHPGGIA